MTTPNSLLRISDFRTNFSRGEISPLFMARADTDTYSNGAERIRNFYPQLQGGLKFRPGSKFRIDSTAWERLRLGKFFSAEGGRFIVGMTGDYGGAGTGRVVVWEVDNATGALTQRYDAAVSDWDGVSRGKFRWAQAGNTMIVCHPDAPVKRLFLDPAGPTWSVSNLTFDDSSGNPPIFQPYFKYADANVTLAASARSGTGITLTTSVNHFVAQHVGKIVRIGKKELEITAVASGTSATATARQTLPEVSTWTFATNTDQIPLNSVIVGADSGIEAVVLSRPGATTLQVLVLNGGSSPISDEYFNSPGGSIKYSSGSGTTTSIPATTEWDEQAFSEIWGYPRSVAFHDQRLVFGGTDTLPLHFWMSRAGEYFAFDLGDGEASDGISAEMDADGVGGIQHVVSNRHLQFFTDQAEFYCPQGDTSPLGPDNISVRRQSDYGSGDVRPRPFDGATIFVPPEGTNVREMLYTDTEQAYSADSLSFQAEHLIKKPLAMDTLTSGLDEEAGLSLIVQSDGSIAVFMSLRKEGISGWTRWETDGSYRGIVTIGGRIYVQVERVIDSVTKWYLEEFSFDTSLDCAIFAAPGSPTTDYSGLSHLEGKTIRGSVGTLYFGEGSVASGAVTLEHENNDGDSVWLGLPYSGQIKTLPFVADIGQGPVVGETKRVVGVDLYLNESVTLKSQGRRMWVRRVDDALGSPPVAKTGVYRVNMLGWDKTAQVELIHDLPLPLTVLGMRIEVAL